MSVFSSSWPAHVAWVIPEWIEGALFNLLGCLFNNGGWLFEGVFVLFQLDRSVNSCIRNIIKLSLLNSLLCGHLAGGEVLSVHVVEHVWLAVICLHQGFHVQGELNGISCGSSSEIILSGLESLGPGVEMSTAQLGEGGVGHVDVQGLTLADEGGSGTGQVDKLFLWDFPNSLVQLFKVIWNFFNWLDTTVVSN